METRQNRDVKGRPGLPVRLTRFIGREREITDLAQLLAEVRLVTLVGVPGVGKTRLALQVAARAQSDFAENVWCVELAGLSEPDLLPGAIASALGVVDQPGHPMVDTLIEHLQSRQLLLVIDNCEHLVASCAALAEALLRACPELHVLATSREALRIEGETTWRVPSLSVPDRQRSHPVTSALAAELLQFEAVRLFVDRARAVRPSFALTDRNADAVVQICRRLEAVMNSEAMLP